MLKRFSWVFPAAVLLAALVAGCSREPARTAGPAGSPTRTGDPAGSPVGTAAPAGNTETAVPTMRAAVLNPEQKAWPREVRDAEGNVIAIPSQPQRIHTLSLGYDELSMALVGPEGFAAIGKVALNPMYGNIPDQAGLVARAIGRNAEEILAARPDLVVASPYSDKELVRQLRDAGLTVVVSDLNDSLEGHVNNIRFLAYLYGEEERGEALIREVEKRLQRLDALVAAELQAHARPLVIQLSSRLNTPGNNTTMDGIIRRAGGANAAAEAGLEKWQQITLEKVVELKPDVIIFGDYDAAEKDFGAELLGHPSLQNVPAIVNQRVYQLPHRFISTLSHWNVRGAEELARLLWPEGLKGVTFEDYR